MLGNFLISARLTFLQASFQRLLQHRIPLFNKLSVVRVGQIKDLNHGLMMMMMRKIIFAAIICAWKLKGVRTVQTESKQSWLFLATTDSQFKLLYAGISI